MKIFFTGGTGFVGSYWVPRLAEEGHEITVLTRSRRGPSGRPEVRFLQGDPLRPGEWQKEAAGHEAVINLAGSSIFTRWTRRARRMIRDSRIEATRRVVEALSREEASCRVLLSASAVGYYGGREDDLILDEDGPAGNDFLAELARDWEAEALKAETSSVRVAIVRLGIVLGRNGGALQQMAPIFRKCLGSPLGNGDQWLPWIHEDDFYRMGRFALETDGLSGPFNATAPHPARNREFSKTLASVVHRPLLPSVPGFLIRTVLGEFGDVLLKGQRAVPKRFSEHGFRFGFPELQPALEDLLG